MNDRHYGRMLRVRYCLVALAVFCTGWLWSELANGEEAPLPKPYCGADCLYIGLKSLDVDVPAYNDFIALMGEPRSSGFSMADLKAQAERFGGTATGVVTSIRNLASRKERFVCIGWLKRGHFVLLADVDPSNKEVYVVDYPSEATISFTALESQWNGEALLVSRGPMESEEVVNKRSAGMGLPSTKWLIGYGSIAVGCTVLLLVALKKIRR